MKKILVLAVALLLLTACKHREDFAFSGTVIDYEYCTSETDLGFAVQLQSPDTLGSTYYTGTNDRHENVIVIFGNTERIYVGDHISGRIYIDPNYSKAYCHWHYRESRGDVPEAVFTELTIHD